jgi:3'(2'), 5'-bisphosphate nucleotidase
VELELKNIINYIIPLAKGAGKIIMENYNHLEVVDKEDNSPVTNADIRSNNFIIEQLHEKYDFPILSEEEIAPYSIRQFWQYFWLIDPLDGTRDFIHGSNDFTVNISLIYQNRPILGVVYAPATNDCWSAYKDGGAFYNGVKVINSNVDEEVTGVDSNFHSTKMTKDFLDLNSIHKIKRFGSSIKMCKVADGSADIYPRLNGTKEWDTAASEIILEESNCEILTWPDKKKLVYNKNDLSNPFFVAARKNFNWK